MGSSGLGKLLRTLNGYPMITEHPSSAFLHDNFAQEVVQDNIALKVVAKTILRSTRYVSLYNHGATPGSFYSTR